MSTFRSISTLTVLNVIGAAIGVANSVVVARLFGTSTEVAVYFGASTLLAMMVSLTQSGQLVEILLPLYHRRKESAGAEAAHRSFAVVFNWLTLALAGLSVLLALAAPVLVRLLLPGFEPESQQLGVKVFVLLAPLVGLRPLKGLMHMLANAERQFGRPESFGVVGNVISIVAVIALAPTFGVWALVGALWIGDLVGVLGLAWVLRRMGYRHRAILRDAGFDHLAVFGQLLHTAWYLISTQFYAFILNAGLSLLSESTFAVFKYVQTVYLRTNGILLRPFSVVFFTNFSEAVGRGVDALWDLGRRALRQTFAASSLAFVTITVAGYPLLSALWGGEKFGQAELELAHKLLSFMFLLLYGAGVGQMARKASMSLGHVKELYLGMSLTQVISAGAAWYLIRTYGITGAVSTLALNVVLLSSVPVLLMLRTYGRFFFYPIQTLGRWSVCVAASLAVGFLLTFLHQADGLLLPGWLGQLLWAFLLAALSAGVLLSAAWLVGADEVRMLAFRLMRKADAVRS